MEFVLAIILVVWR